MRIGVKSVLVAVLGLFLISWSWAQETTNSEELLDLETIAPGVVSDCYNLIFKKVARGGPPGETFSVNLRDRDRTYFLKLGKEVDGFKVVHFADSRADTSGKQADELTLQAGEKKIILTKGKALRVLRLSYKPEKLQAVLLLGDIVKLAGYTLRFDEAHPAEYILLDVQTGEEYVVKPKKSSDKQTGGTNSTQDAVNPVIGHLKTKDKLITIRTGQDGPLYTVKSNDGKVLALDIPATELFAKFPELKDLAESGIADWAGLDANPSPNWQEIQSPIDAAPPRSYGTVIIEHGK